MRGLRFALMCVVVVAPLGFSGCGGKTKAVPTSGVLTLDGEPLADARVTFTPASGVGRLATGVTDGQGRFQLTTFEVNDGCLPGDYKITVMMVGPSAAADPKIATDLKFMNKERDRLSKLKLKEIHKNYQNVTNSPLQQSIPADGEVKLTLNKNGN